MSDTWSDIQALKSKQSSLREKLARRKKEREAIIEGIALGPDPPAPVPVASVSPTKDVPASTSAASSTVSVTKSSEPAKDEAVHFTTSFLKKIERQLLLLLSDITMQFPAEATELTEAINKQLESQVPLLTVEDLLEKFAAQMLITINLGSGAKSGKNEYIVDSINHTKLSAVTNEFPATAEDTHKRKREQDTDDPVPKKLSKQPKKDNQDIIESLLLMESAKQRASKRMNDEILQLLHQPTVKEQTLSEKFRSQGGAQVKEFCQYGTKEECYKISNKACDKLHFRKIIHKHTDESLGDCSFLNTCFHMDTCKYVHYEIDYPDIQPMNIPDLPEALGKGKEESTILYPPQWIQCDLRNLDMAVLGKFAVIMADPPWDIHMELPYGTMGDDEMRGLPVPMLQDDGYIFLWVTGRAMELGRECLQLWGYERVDELIWVKTNQLQRIIRTGRTGHWLNHGKEHCLVGVKGSPKSMNRGLDCDVIVAEVRATSHKPDEIYGIIERLAPGTRKVELFGRPHNVQPNWITLGNQLDGTKLIDPDVVKAFRKMYPDGNCAKPSR